MPRTKTPRRRAGTALLASLLTAGTAVVAVATGPLTSSAATPTANLTAGTPAPRTPSGLAAAIEVLQPYVGQKVCDPVAKPGVVAFRDLLLATYPASSSLGIVRDCGSGGQSEHKEGRAFDWGNDLSDPTDAANVSATLAWLTRTDQYGNTNAMVRRTGLMYMIWNRKIWKSYEAAKGWQPYYGASPHTDHVHFSFGWNGARKATSYWQPGEVAPVDFGPGSAPAPRVTVTADRSNITLQRAYGQLTLAQGQAQSADAVKAMQRKVLASPVDGIFGPGTASALRSAQSQVGVPVTGSFTPADWDAFFPLPTAPFGAVTSVTTVPGGVRVVGWALDYDTREPISVTLGNATLGRVGLTTAAGPSAEVGRLYPEVGPNHAFDVTVQLPDGRHSLCANGINSAGTPGTNTTLGCATVTVKHAPQGVLDDVLQRYGATLVTGWALDTDTPDPVQVDLSVDGRVVRTVTASVEERPDAVSVFREFGAMRGYRVGLDVPEGTHTVCATARNLDRGGDARLGCDTLRVDRSAKGGFNTAGTVPAEVFGQRGPVVVKGWALDPDTDGPTAVRIRVDGVVRRTVKAEAPRADVARAYPLYGADHGFDLPLAVPDGVHEICVEAVNLGSRGSNRDLGCKTVTVGHPVGVVQNALGAKGAIAAAGWAFDPDAARTVGVVVFVDGKRAGVLRTGRERTDLGAVTTTYGPDRGFGGLVAASPGRHRVCFVAYNVVGTPGKNSPLGCRTLTVR